VVDCPFEAIAMVPNTTGRGTHAIASVNPARCVSCGLCSGSCDQLAIGPPSRDGHAQMQAVKGIAATADAGAFALVHCGHDGVGERLAARLAAGGHRVALVAVDCVGALHALAVSQLAASHRGAFVLGCPPHRCRSREGVWISLGRLLQGREPELKHPLDPTRVRDVGTRADTAGFFAGRVRGARGIVAAAAASAVALAIVAWLSQLPAGAAPAHGAVRLAWRLPGQSWRDCSPLSPGEIAKLPAHMRRTEDCRTVYLHYRLRAWVDGRAVLDREVAPLGARGDRPLYVEADLDVRPGERHVRVEFVPVRDPEGRGARLSFESGLQVEAGRARLIYHDADARALRAD
jgi:ferredoxin